MDDEKEPFDKKADEYYKSYYQSIYRYCRVRLGEYGDHAEDCVQDAFLVLHDKLKSGETVEQPRAFLYRTADNFVKRTVDYYQKQLKRTVPLEEAETAQSPPIIPDSFDYEKCARLLIKSLTQDEQQLYRLKYIEKKSLKDIAAMLNISPVAAAKRTSRLRAQVKEIIYQNNLFGNEVRL